MRRPAEKLLEKVRASMPDIPWKEIVGFRIVVDHADHRLDYGRGLRAAIERFRG